MAGLTALLLLAAVGVTLRLLAYDLPAACLDPGSSAALCRGRGRRHSTIGILTRRGRSVPASVVRGSPTEELRV